MATYTIEVNGTGDVIEGQFRSETDAQSWVESVLEDLGYDANEIVNGDWDANGQNDGGDQCYRMLFWANESESENDSGVNAICQLCKVE